MLSNTPRRIFLRCFLGSYIKTSVLGQADRQLKDHRMFIFDLVTLTFEL